MGMENGIISVGKTTDLYTRDLLQYYQQSHLEAKQEEPGEGNEFGVTKYFCLYFEGSLTRRKILGHGADGFTSAPKECMLRHLSPLKINRPRPEQAYSSLIDSFGNIGSFLVYDVPNSVYAQPF
jgi:hypothetical protein